MIDAIINNPFRILGVYTNASLKDITANKGKMTAFLKVGKAVEFTLDSLCSDAVTRSQEHVTKAESELVIPKEKVLHALFWYCNVTPIDNIAFASLLAGDNAKAIDVWSKKESFSSEINRGVFYLSRGMWKDAILSYLTFFHNCESVESFVAIIAGDTYSSDYDELRHSFIDILIKQAKGVNWPTIFKECGAPDSDVQYVKSLFISGPKSIVTDAIAEAKATPSKDAEANLRAGTKLMTVTKEALGELKVLLGTESDDYRIIADKLANEILQCGINYYNNSDDDDSSTKAMTLQKYAESIAVGKMCKDRCVENVRILNDIINRESVEKEAGVDLEKIKSLLSAFQTKNDSISNVETFITDCAGPLSNIKNKFGAANQLYVTISSAIVNNALNMVISVCNSNMDSRSIVKQATDVMTRLSALDMDYSTKKRFDTNRATLLSNYVRMPNGYEKVDNATGGCLSTILGYLLFGGIIAGIAAIFDYPEIGIPIVVAAVLGFVIYKVVKKRKNN